MDKRLTPAGIALLYAAFASLWIFASDRLLAFAVLTSPPVPADEFVQLLSERRA